MDLGHSGTLVSNVPRPCGCSFGKVAGCMPRFKIGGTISNVKVIYKSIEDIKIMMNETIVESLKKKGKLLPALFLLRTLLICKCTNYFS